MTGPNRRMMRNTLQRHMMSATHTAELNSEHFLERCSYLPDKRCITQAVEGFTTVGVAHES